MRSFLPRLHREARMQSLHRRDGHHGAVAKDYRNAAPRSPDAEHPLEDAASSGIKRARRCCRRLRLRPGDTSVRYGTVYYLSYRYEYHRKTYTHNQRVDEDTFHIWSEGGNAEVRCLPMLASIARLEM